MSKAKHNLILFGVMVVMMIAAFFYLVSSAPIAGDIIMVEAATEELPGN